MTKPEISDEAVEAAGKAVLANAEKIQTIEYATDIARWALEAAAPHLGVPRAVTTIEELNGLPAGAIVRTAVGSVYVKEALHLGHSTWVTTNEQFYFGSIDIELPVTLACA